MNVHFLAIFPIIALLSGCLIFKVQLSRINKLKKQNEQLLKKLEARQSLIKNLQNKLKTCFKDDTIYQDEGMVGKILAGMSKKGVRFLTNRKLLIYEIKEILPKLLARGGAKKIPFLGFFAGIGLGAIRLANGQIGRAGLEVASGTLGSTGVGAIPSMGIDASLIIWDVIEDLQKKGMVSCS